MEKQKKSILIAFNSSPEDRSRSFFQSCADEVRQLCVDASVPFSSKTGDELTEQSIMRSMDNHSLCVFAAHGSSDSIVDENGNDVISTRTANYTFKGKGLYAVTCWCAKSLMPELRQVGLSLFVGYDDEIRFSGEESVFVDCALSGLRSFVFGKNLELAKADMLSSFDEAIKMAAANPNPFEKMFLLHNKESLVFFGNPELMLADLS
ncbi:MAG: hypothetical protein J6Y78_02360 [Paludibacteraceae bacterium]|nr:hypothetical protein [Paludibacteraceae bacterium]